MGETFFGKWKHRISNAWLVLTGRAWVGHGDPMHWKYVGDPAERIAERNLRTEGWIPKCRRCGKTPQDIGWCDECGYNRDYEMVRSATIQ